MPLSPSLRRCEKWSASGFPSFSDNVNPHDKLYPFYFSLLGRFQLATAAGGHGPADWGVAVGLGAIDFAWRGHQVHVTLGGAFNVPNALAALRVWLMKSSPYP